MSLLGRLADNRDPQSLASRLRRERFRRVLELLRAAGPRPRVLDVGGTWSYWRQMLAEMDLPIRLTLLNLNAAHVDNGGGLEVESVAGDARHMPQFDDRSFDLVFSNSVIEHVGGDVDQQAMADEVRRVGRAYYVQTPHLHFPIEAHYLFPFWQYLPLAARGWLASRRSWGWMPRATDSRDGRVQAAGIRLLDARRMRALFPDGLLARERLGPLTKSLIAIRHTD